MNKIGHSICITAITDVGLVRKHNEDNFLACRDLSLNDWQLAAEPCQPGPIGALLAVADGMGGLNAGEVASAIAVNAIQQYFSKLPLIYTAGEVAIEDIMKDSILFANGKLVGHTQQNHAMRGMGTTMVLAWIIDNSVNVCWCGDSRAYLFRRGQGIRQISRDHSYVQRLIDEGDLKAEEAFMHPGSNIITEYLSDAYGIPEPDSRTEPLQQGDYIMLCSDGLSDMLQDKGIENILFRHPDIEVCMKELITEANRAGGFDNITIVLAELVSIAN